MKTLDIVLLRRDSLIVGMDMKLWLVEKAWCYISATTDFHQKLHVHSWENTVLRISISLFPILELLFLRFWCEWQTHTHKQTDYRNPHCACTPRVNYTTLHCHILVCFYRAIIIIRKRKKLKKRNVSLGFEPGILAYEFNTVTNKSPKHHTCRKALYNHFVL